MNQSDSLKLGLESFEAKKYELCIKYWSGYESVLVNERDSIAVLLAYAYAEIGNKSKSLKLIEEILQVHESSLALIYAGHIYRLSEDDLERAIAYFEKGLLLIKKENHDLLLSAYNGLGQTQTVRHQLDEANRWRKEYLNLSLSTYGKFHKKTAVALNNLSIIHYYRTDYDNAIYYLGESLNIYENLGLNAEAYLSYRNMGVYHMFLAHLPEAKFYLKKSLDYGLQGRSETDFRLRRIYYYLGCTYFFDQKFDSANYFIERSILSNLNHSEPVLNPKFEEIRSFESWLYSIWRLGQINARLDNWDLAKKTFQYADSVITYRNFFAKSRLSPLVNTGVIELIYFTALDASMKFDDTEAAFYFLQKSKLNNYNNAFRTDKLSSLPDSIRSATRKLELELLGQQYSNVLDGDQEVMNSLDSIYRSNNGTMRNIQTEVTSSASDLMRKLDKHTVLIDYFEFDQPRDTSPVSKMEDHFLKKIFCLIVTKDKWLIKTLVESPKLNREIEKYIQLSEQGKALEALDSIDFQVVSNHLMLPVLEEIDADISKLIIIPDGRLSGVPFELLRDERGEELFRNYSISYQFSSHPLTPSEKGSVQSVAMFAPDYSKLSISANTKSIPSLSFSELVREGKHHLPGARLEVEGIADLLNDHISDEVVVTEKSFLKQLVRAGIVHFSGHAISIPQHPMHSYLAFNQNESEDGYLEVSEILNQEIESELVVLSACQTGLIAVPDEKLVIKKTASNLRSVQSIGSAFIRSGTKSVLSTLWKIPDETSPEIVINFYENLKQGMTKSVALRQAKLTYLENQENPLKRHPYFWAGFVLTGDDSPVDFEKAVVWPWYIMSIIILFVLFLFVEKRRKLVVHQ